MIARRGPTDPPTAVTIMPKTPGPKGPPKLKPKPKPQKAAPPLAKEPAYQPGVVGKFPFDHEMATFRARLPELLEREGAYAVIRGEEIAGIRDDFSEAVGLGYDRFGIGNFMVRKITAEEPFFPLPRPVAY